MTKKTLYVDAAASSLKPKSVIDAESDFLRHGYANAGRGICARAAAVDEMVDQTRATVARFIGARPEQIIFTSNATDGLNRIPHILEISGALKSGAAVFVSDLDHHSARLPFEELAYQNKCAVLRIPLDAAMNLDFGWIVKGDIFVITAMSNVLGVPQDVKKWVAAAKKINPDALTIVDAAQYVAHLPIDVADWDCDFLCFSGHKIGADTGIGVMYVKEPGHWPADKLGGGMVASVTERADIGQKLGPTSEWQNAAGPAKFEAGTLPLTQIVGLGAAIAEKEKDIANNKKEKKMLEFLRGELSKMPRVKFISPEGASVLTFVVDGMHVLDFGTMAGAHGICLRVGHMCASWLHAHLGLSGTIRISVGPWNTMAEMKEIVQIIKGIIK